MFIKIITQNCLLLKILTDDYDDDERLLQGIAAINY